MSFISENSPHRLTQLHHAIAVRLFGGNGAAIRVEGGGANADFLRLTMVEETEGVDDTVLAVFVAAHGSLDVTTDKSTIDADGVDAAAIECEDVAIAGDVDVAYYVWENGVKLLASGDAPVVGGVVEIAFSAGDEGTYVIEIRRKGVSDFETGYIQIEAVIDG